jgi:hypothetical protein
MVDQPACSKNFIRKAATSQGLWSRVREYGNMLTGVHCGLAWKHNKHLVKVVEIVEIVEIVSTSSCQHVKFQLLTNAVPYQYCRYHLVPQDAEPSPNY